MSTPTQTLTTTPFGTKPVGNDSQDHSAPNAMAADREIHTVVAFNHHPTEIYMDHSAVGGDVILVDISSSIAGPNAILLRTAVAAMTKGTNSHGKFVIPTPDGSTGIISAVKHCLKMPNCGTIYLFTDGEENCWSGPLKVGKKDDGFPKIVDVRFGFGQRGTSTTRGTPAVLADYLQASGVKVCILGIGDAAKPMVNEMLGRSNVYCGFVTHGADTKAVVSTVRTLKRISKGGKSSVTRNGTQHAVLVPLTDDVQESIQKMTPAEMDEFDDAVGSTIISGTDIVTPSDLKRHMELVFNEYDEPIPDDHIKNVKAALLLVMEAMCDAEMPGALITSKHSAIIGVPKDWKPFRRHCNRLLSRLACGDMLHRTGPVPDGGKVITENGHQHKFAAGCAQYSCKIIKAVVTGLSEDEEYCTPRDELPGPKIKKRKRVDNKTHVKKVMRVD